MHHTEASVRYNTGILAPDREPPRRDPIRYGILQGSGINSRIPKHSPRTSMSKPTPNLNSITSHRSPQSLNYTKKVRIERKGERKKGNSRQICFRIAKVGGSQERKENPRKSSKSNKVKHQILHNLRAKISQFGGPHKRLTRNNLPHYQGIKCRPVIFPLLRRCYMVST
jgi:hypothetical protein